MLSELISSFLNRILFKAFLVLNGKSSVEQKS